MAAVQVKRVVEQVSEFPGLGAAIKKAREEDRRSLAQICRESGISRAYWYQLEREDLRAPATEAIIRKVEAALGCDLNVVFDRATPEASAETITLEVIANGRKHKRVRSADGVIYNLKRVENSVDGEQH